MIMENRLSEGPKNYYMYDQYGNNPMEPLGPVALIALDSMHEFADKVNSWLRKRRIDYAQNFKNMDPVTSRIGFLRDNYCLNCECIRYESGEGKAVLNDTIRGHDVFILVDVLNHSITYPFFNQNKPMTPDEHYQDLKRVILAISGKARRINVIMPFLYESRQHKRSDRESLDCAYMLEELATLGVENIITFDAHDPRVSNAIPLIGFENIPSTYQILKTLLNNVPDLELQDRHLMVISPDEGAIPRAMYYASMVNAPLGTFYKRRDYSRIVNGRNPIIAHEFLGETAADMDVLIVDDMISSGDSMLDIAKELKKRDAKRIFCASAFALFTNGLEVFDKAYKDGLIDKVFGTNLIYRTPELLQRPWFVDVDCSKFVGLLIDAINHDASLSELISPTQKIERLIEKYNKKR